MKEEEFVKQEFGVNSYAQLTDGKLYRVIGVDFENLEIFVHDEEAKRDFWVPKSLILFITNNTPKNNSK